MIDQEQVKASDGGFQAMLTQREMEILQRLRNGEAFAFDEPITAIDTIKLEAVQ